MATSAPKHQLLPWTTAHLVPEALRHSLHVVEDPALMKLLGRSKFVDMVVFGASGWQPGVSHLLDFFFVHTAIFSMCFVWLRVASPNYEGCPSNLWPFSHISLGFGSFFF